MNRKHEIQNASDKVQLNIIC